MTIRTRTKNILKKYGLESIKVMEYKDIKNISGMTSKALREIIALTDDIMLMKQLLLDDDFKMLKED